MPRGRHGGLFRLFPVRGPAVGIATPAAVTEFQSEICPTAPRRVPKFHRSPAEFAHQSTVRRLSWRCRCNAREFATPH
jgi:hypothetical protein